MTVHTTTGPQASLPSSPPSPPGPLLELAVRERIEVAIAEGDLDGALEQIEQGLARFPASGELWLHRGRINAQLGRHAAASSAYEAALVLVPGHSEAIDHFVGRARATGDHGDAVRWLTRRLAHCPTDAHAYARRALALRFCEQPRAAACDAALAIVLLPEAAEEVPLGSMQSIVSAYLASADHAAPSLEGHVRERLRALPGDATALDGRADRLAELLDASARARR